MQARHWRGVAAVAAVTTLLAAFAGGAQAKTESGSGQSAAAPYKVGIVYSRTGLLAAYGAEYIQGLRYGLAYATQGKMTVNGRKIELDDRRRRHRPDEGRRGRARPDRQGLQDPRRQRLLGRRAPDGAAGRAEQGALHLRPRGHGRDHRDQQVHVPLRAPDLPGRQDGRDVPARASARRSPSSRRTRPSASATTRRSTRSSGRRATTSAACSCRSRRRTSRRSPSR